LQLRHVNCLTKRFTSSDLFLRNNHVPMSNNYAITHNIVKKVEEMHLLHCFSCK